MKLEELRISDLGLRIVKYHDCQVYKLACYRLARYKLAGLESRNN